MKLITIGEKIKFYRKRAGLSQMDLELAMGIASSSLSKMESDRVIPTRETLIKLAGELNLSVNETVSLLGLSIVKLADVVDIISKINILETEEEVAQCAVNEIPKVMNILGASFNLVFEDKLQTMAFTQSWYSELILKILPFRPQEFFVDMNRDQRNLMVKSIREGREIVAYELSEFTLPSMSKRISDLLQKTANVRTLISVPLVVGNQIFGTILYVKAYQLDFEEELPLLKAYTNVIATCIYNLRRKKSF